jgi:hydrogenase expression/formation protein HypE
MNFLSATCALPDESFDRITLGHGSGGRLSEELLRRVFLPAFDGGILGHLEDQACLDFGNASHRLAFTTDSFVVRPIFFPGGDIGKLSVCGTINDLAMGGAVPRFLAAAFILEEGLPIRDLERVVASMRETCRAAGVELVTGDTKVVDRGKGDKLFITTTGIGVIPGGARLSIAHAQPGDKILVSGTLGDHGVAILSVREGLEFETQLESDCAPLHDLAAAVLRAAPGMRCMRDPTRGGLAAALHELAEASRVGVHIREEAIPVRAEVRSACEIFGLDPLYVANEGKLMAVVPANEAAAALAALQSHPLGRNAALVGDVAAEGRAQVTLQTRLGGERLVTQIAGEQLPRIC